MTKSENAVSLYKNGHNCAQAILVTFAQEVGIDEALAFRIGAGLGGGIGKTQNVCGAINAGAIVLGLKNGNYLPADIDSKNDLSSLTRAFMERCKNTLGATQCLELVKVDITNQELKELAEMTGHLAEVCDNAVAEVARILEGILAEH